MNFIDDNRKLGLQKFNNFIQNRQEMNRQANRSYVESTPYGQPLANDEVNIGYSDKDYIDSYLDELDENNPTEQEDDSIVDKLYVVRAGKTLLDVGRLLTKKAAETILSSNIKDRDNSNQELNNANLIHNYYDNINQLKNLSKKIEQSIKNTGLSVDEYVDGIKNGSIFAYDSIKQLCEQYDKCRSTLDYLDNYFKTEGRYSDIIANTMFSNKQGSVLDNLRIGLASANQYTKHSDDLKTGSLLEQFGANLMNIPGSVSGLWAFAVDLAQGTTTKSAIQSVNDGDQLINALYKGRNLTQQDMSELKKEEDWHNRLLKESDIKIKADLDFYRSGVLHPSVIAKTIAEYIPFVDDTKDQQDLDPIKDNVIGADWNSWKFYNPENIDPQYAKDQEEGNWKIWRPDYWIPEVGSTIGLGVGMVGSMFTNAGANYAVKHLPVWLAKKTGAGLAADITESLIMGSQIASSVGFAKKSREMETAGEAANALASKMVENLAQNGVAYESTMNQLSQGLKDFGIDTKNLKPQEIIQLAIAYNIKTSNPDYNNSLYSAREGLGKLINANNSLAYIDYLETLPFMSYGGSVYRAFGNTMSRLGGGLVGNRGFMLMSSKTAEEFAQKQAASKSMKIAESISERTGAPLITGKYTLPTVGNVLDDIAVPVVNRFKPEVTAVFDGIIDRQAEKAIEQGFIKKGLRIKHFGDAASNFLKKSAAIGVNEGIEEGNQELLQSRYARGEYAGYHEPYSIFNLPEMFRDVELSTQAIADFLGVNFGDPDNGSSNVRRAMLVGFLASLGLPVGGSLASNAFGKNGNIRGLVSQLRSDARAADMLTMDNETIQKLKREVKDNKVLLKMIGDNLGGEQDDQRIGMFFDAFHRFDIDNKSLGKSLRDYMNLIDKDDLVSKQFVKDDILLMNAAWQVYNNKTILENLKKDGLKKYGKEHRAIVQEGAARIVQTAKSEELMGEGLVNARQHKFQTRSLISEYLDDATSNERKSEIAENDPYVSKIIHYARTLFDNSVSRIKNTLNTSYEDFIKNPFVKKQIEGRRGTEDQGSIRRSFEDVAKELFNNEQSRTSLIENAINNNSKSIKELAENLDDLYHDLQERLVAEEVLSVLKDQEKFQKELGKATGLDIDVKNLKGASSILENIIKLQKEKEKNTSKNSFVASDGHEMTYEEFFEDMDEFSDAEEYKKNLIGYFMNASVYEAQATIRNAFLQGTDFYFGQIQAPDVDLLNTAMFGEDGDSVISELAKQFKKLRKEYQDKDQLERSSADKHDINALKKDASWKLIKGIIQDREKRQRIAHRIFQEDRPINAQDIDDAENGDQNAREKINPSEKKSLSELGTQEDLESSIRSESDAERRSRQALEGADLQAERMRKAAEEEAKRRKKEEDQVKEHKSEQNEHESQEKSKEEPEPEPKSKNTVEEIASAVQQIAEDNEKREQEKKKRDIQIATMFTVPEEIDSTDVNKIIEQEKKKRISNTKQDEQKRQQRKQRYSKFGKANKIVTVEQKDKAVKEIIKGLNNLNSSVNPETIENLVKIAVFVVEAGSRKFVEFVQDMYEQLKEGGLTDEQINQLSPYFKDVYMKAISNQQVIENALNNNINVAPPENEKENTASIGDEAAKKYAEKLTQKYQTRLSEIEKIQNDDEFESEANKLDSELPYGFVTILDRNKLIIKHVEPSFYSTGILNNTPRIFKPGDKIQLEIDGRHPFVNVTKVENGKVIEAVDAEDGRTIIKDGKILSTSEILDQEKEDPEDVIDKFIGNSQFEDPLSDEQLIFENKQLQTRLQEDIDKHNTEAEIGAKLEMEASAREHAATIAQTSENQSSRAEETPVQTDDDVNEDDSDETQDPTEEELERQKKEQEAIEKHNAEAEADANAQMNEAYQDRALEISVSESLLNKNIDVQDGELIIDGHVVDREQQRDIELELSLLLKADTYSNVIDYSSIPNKDGKIGTVQNRRDLSKYVSQTFFYQPDATSNMELRINGKDVVLEHPLAPGSQLAKNLIKDGWFDNCKKYYIVTQSLQAKNIEDPDTFTVALILDDGKNSYAVSLRKLGTERSFGENDSVYDKNNEFNLRQWLSKMSTEYEDQETSEATKSLLNVELSIAEDIYSQLKQQRPVLREDINGDETEQSVKQRLSWTKKAHDWYLNAPKRNNFSSESSYNKAISEWKQIVDDIKEKARFKARKQGFTPLTNKEIDEQIQQLRELRMQIINSVISKKDGKYIFPDPEKQYPQHVKPKFATKSNGKINTIIDEDGKHVFRKIDEDSIEEITQKLNNGELLFGIGLGFFSKLAPGQFKIRDLGDTGVEYIGTGLSGKIFLMVPGNDGYGNSQRIPIMLSEAKFNSQQREVEKEDGSKETVSKFIKPAYIQRKINESKNKDSNVVLAIDPNTNEAVGGKYKPSAAEVLLYLICGRTPKNDKFFGKNGNQDLAYDLANMFINNGEITLLNSKNRQAKKLLEPFAQKQIAWYIKDGQSSYTFAIALPKEVQNEDGSIDIIYEVEEFTEDDIFQNTDSANNNRRLIVSAIATQMHWNTEEDHMMSTFKDPQFENIINALNSYFKQYDEESVSLFGCEDFTFNKDDFFDEDMDLKGNVSVLAWMIATKRLFTDVGKQIFKDPFVFANGVQKDSVKEDLDKTKKAAGKSVEEKQVSIVEAVSNEVQKKVQNLKSVSSKFVLKQGEEKKAVLDYYSTRQDVVQNEGLKDLIALDITEYKKKHPKTILQEIKKKVDQYVKQNGISEVNYSSIEDNGEPRTAILSLINTNKAYPVIKVFNNGTCKVELQTVKGGASATVEKGVTGVFSKIKSRGKLNEKNARKWLKKTLGLNKENVIVENAIMRSLEGEQVYGITCLSLDALGQLSGDIQLYRNAGAGIHYHEAWHYVNLLLHTSQDREILYEEYEKLHPKLKGKTYKEIEEAMAEDFRRYMEMRDSYNPIKLLRRLYDNVITFINVSKNRSAYRYVFNKIRKGGYQTARMDSKSVSEFQKRYPGGVYFEGYIQGVPKEVLDKMKTIKNYRDFYNTAYAVVNHIIDYFDIDSIETLREVSGKGFKDTLQIIKDFADQQEDPGLADSIMDLYNNPLAFQKVLIQQFSKYGIKAKIKSFSKNENDSDEDEQEELEENPFKNYDKFDLGISGKDNVALRAKLFMSRIPVLKPVQYEIEEGGKTQIIEEWEEELDPFNNPKLYSFSEVWVAMNDYLHNTDSFDKKDEKGDYLPNSTLGIAQRVSKSNPMFVPIFRKLEKVVDKDDFDISLKQTLQATLNRSKPNIQFVQLSDPRGTKQIGEADAMIQMMYGSQDSNSAYSKTADRNRVFELFNDARFSISKSIPRRWSKNAMLKGLAVEKDGKSVVNELFAKQIVEALGYDYEQFKSNKNIQRLSPKEKSLMYYLDKLAPKKGVVVSSQEQIQYMDEIKNKLVFLLNSMGIEADEYSVKTLVNMHIQESPNVKDKNNPSVQDYINAYTQILRKTGSKKGGGIIQTIRLIVDSVNNEVLNTGQKEGKPIEDVYNRYGYDTEISKLALSYNATYPSSQEFSVKGPNGDMLYPISQNNFVSDVLRWLNNEEGLSNDKNASSDKQSYAQKLRKSDYCRNSQLLKIASDLDDTTSQDDKFKLYAFVGLKDVNENQGADYTGLTTLEDYILKMCILESDHWTKQDYKKAKDGGLVNKIGQIIQPTMADKKTYYSIGSRRLRLSHDAVIKSVPYRYINRALQEVYLSMNKDSASEFEKLKSLEKEKIASDWYEKNNTEEIVNDVNTTALSLYTSEHGDILRYGDVTLNRFLGYFEDELRSLIAYYDKKNISKLVNNQNIHIENFHGNVKNGRMDMNGNGGKFRYFFDTIEFIDENGKVYNLNQKLQYLWNLQKEIEAGSLKLDSTKEGDDFVNVAASVLGDPQSLDGFELIRQYLEQFKTKYFGRNWVGGDREFLKNKINRVLINTTNEELEKLSKDPAIKCVNKDSNGNYIPYSIPKQFLQNYADDFERLGIFGGGSIYSGQVWIEQNALFSLIANHVANTITSIIEYEKIWAADPAQYKWKNLKGEFSKVEITDKFVTPDGETATFTTMVDNVYDKFSDKIKRLGSQLSPGDEVSLFYNKMEIDKDLDSERPSYLNCTKYTNLNIEDLSAVSLFIDNIRKMFKKQTVIDYIRAGQLSEFEKLYAEKQKDSNITKEDYIDLLYTHDKEFNKLYNTLDSETKNEVENTVNQQISPYTDITVADAQVLIRPSLYRKIRIGLGEWDWESDEEAFNILETDDSWMNDPEKARIVRKFQAYPLKMSYFQNDPFIAGTQNINLGLLNKMAIFPAFKFMMSNDVGRQIYSRMNKKGHELDMISFKSAVKVGAIKNASDPIEKDSFGEMCYLQAKAFGKNYDEVRKEIFKYFNKKGMSEDQAKEKAQSYDNKKLNTIIKEYEQSIPEQMSTLSEQLNRDSDTYIDYKSGEIKNRRGSDTQPVRVQDLKFLRMQLNTKAHEAEERAIGTQMFKIAFSNIFDNSQYGIGKPGVTKSGKQLKNEIMACINALTYLGAKDITDSYYRHGVPDKGLVGKWIKRVIENNGIGSSAEEIINNGGIISSLMSRKVFEQTVSSAVNKSVVNINTHGGSAIQQSSFGFVGFGKQTVATQGSGTDAWGNSFEGQRYSNYNRGEELKWDAENGQMEVILSMKFFKPVLPEDMKNASPNEQKQWLIDNDVIKGIKSDGTASNPKPFGVGYRIPTQGMSSMFSFVVADVMPKQSGDVIIVPREFTAQTGSDFDVDKLFLATTHYVNGKIPDIGMGDDMFIDRFGEEYTLSLTKEEFERQRDIYTSSEEFKKKYGYIIPKKESDFNKMSRQQIQNFLIHCSSAYIQNKLIQSYMTIISDMKNYGISRASIDTLTNKIKSELLPSVQEKHTRYISGFYELTPSFQAVKKQEFGGGKNGIAPFALNITHLSLTQFTHLSLDYKKEDEGYNFGDLDKIYGQDKLSIAGWLSAMVNACVDVAKDPYIFDININSETFNHATFLIRAGKGMSTFTFLAQPAIKKYATQAALSKSIYGGNVEGKNTQGSVSDINSRSIRKQIINELLVVLDNFYKKQDVQNSLTKEEKELYVKTKAYFSAKKKSEVKLDITAVDVFDKNLALDSIKGWNKDSSNLKKYKSALFQLYAMYAYGRVDTYAKKLSELVHASQIDTKKFGNNITTQLNFLNSHKVMIENEKGWVITTDSQSKKKGDALKVYFTSLYLEDKLYRATKMTREILKDWTYTATDEYSKLFSTICGIMFGEEMKSIVNRDGKVIGEVPIGYKPIKNDDIVESIGEGIDNTMRFNALLNLGYDVYKRNGGLSLGEAEGMIDFTCGGSLDNIIEKSKELFYGSEKTEGMSVVDRLFDFVNDIKRNPDSEYASDLIDKETGEIQNEVLKYLQATPANQQDPIGRITLIHSQMSTDQDKKAILSSAMYQLLTHPSKKVRQLIRDVILYAYYSTYDQNTRNSFMDIVPYEFRKQYDMSLKEGLHNKNAIYRNSKKDKKTSFDDFIRMGGDEGISQQYLSVIARNYWYDDNIVPRYFESRKTQGVFQESGGEIHLNNVNIEGSPYMFSGAILSTYVRAGNTINPKFFKIRKGDIVMLYKNVGTISLGKSKYNMYIAIPKAGLHQGRVKQFEMYADYSTMSIFKENKLPETWSPENILKSLQKVIENTYSYMERNELNADLLQNINMFESYIQEMPSIYKTMIDDKFNDDMYYEVRQMNTAYDGIVKALGVNKNESPKEKASRSSDVIIEINSNEFSGNKTISKKVISLGFGQQLEKLSQDVSGIASKQLMDDEDVQKLSKTLRSQFENIYSTGISLYITGSTDGIKVSQQEINEYIETETNKFMSQHSQEDYDDLQQAKDNYVKYLKTIAESEIIQQKVDNYVQNIVNQLLIEGVRINFINTSNDMSEQFTLAAIKASKNIQEYLTYKKANIYVKKSDIRNGIPDELSEIIRYGNDFDIEDDVQRQVFIDKMQFVKDTYSQIYKTLDGTLDVLEKSIDVQTVEEEKAEKAEKVVKKGLSSLASSEVDINASAVAEKENKKDSEEQPVEKPAKKKKSLGSLGGGLDLAAEVAAKAMSGDKPSKNC